MADTDRRIVYGKSGTPTPLWMWVFQRYSGILLGPLVLVHVLVPHAPFIRWVTALLLAIILGHAFIGLWRLAVLRRLTTWVARGGVLAATVVVVVVGALGIALIISL